MKAVVIGAGIAGMASAIRLARAGYRVEVHEAASQAGGKCNELRRDGFRFDAGPSLFTLPELLDELFADCGENPADHYSYEKVDVVTRYFYPDGKVMDAFSDHDRLADELLDKFGEPRRNTLKHLESARSKYEATKDIFMFSSMQKVETYLQKLNMKVIGSLGEIEAFRSMAVANGKRFKTQEAAQFFNRFATYNGSDPYRAPATLNLIAHLEHQIGAFFMKGGMYGVSRALHKLAVKMGVEFHFGSRVTEILLENEQLRGVQTAGGEIPAELVVSNMDVHPTYRKLLPSLPAPERILRQPKSSSALIFYWGMDTEFPDLDLHNVFFSADYKEEFKEIARGGICNDPTVYLYISSKKCSDDAPAGKENWFCMINVPHEDGQDWEDLIARARKDIILKLEEMIGRPVEKHILFEERLDPLQIEEKTSSYKGALYGNSSNNMMAAFLRHPNFSRRIKGLYFCGGSVHPGGGVPLCLSSARIIEQLVPKPQLA